MAENYKIRRKQQIYNTIVKTSSLNDYMFGTLMRQWDQTFGGRYRRLTFGSENSQKQDMRWTTKKN